LSLDGSIDIRARHGVIGGIQAANALARLKLFPSPQI
jgi:hypothetical protein